MAGEVIGTPSDRSNLLQHLEQLVRRDRLHQPARCPCRASQFALALFGLRRQHQDGQKTIGWKLANFTD